MALNETFNFCRYSVSPDTTLFVSLRKYLFMGQRKPCLIRSHGGGEIFKNWVLECLICHPLPVVSKLKSKDSSCLADTSQQWLLMLYWLWISQFRKSVKVVMGSLDFTPASTIAPVTNDVWLWSHLPPARMDGYFTTFCARKSDLLQCPQEPLGEFCVLTHSGTNGRSEKL